MLLKITLKTLDKTIYQEYIEDDHNVLDLKKQIEVKYLYPIDNLKLLYLGKTLEDNQILNTLNYTENSFIVLFITKKKKNYLR